MAVKKEVDYPIIKINSSNIIMISDIHFGRWSSNDEWKENMSNYFRNWFIPYVKSVKAEHHDVVICCLGDVYNDEKSIEIVVMNLCAEIFNEIAQIVPVYLINGNHDLSKMNREYSSLVTIDRIDNVTIIRQPTMLQFVDGRKNVAKIAAIPYLGDCNDENKQLVKFSGIVDYAFMHTEITGLKFDNGMTIVGAVDSEKFSGKIFAGHIHRRQEGKNVIYVGSPYHLDRGDVGDTKGIYLLNLSTGEVKFTENEYSPKFLRFDITQFLNFTDKERKELLNNNYVEVQISDTGKYKAPDLYDLIKNTGVRNCTFVTAKTKKKKEDGTDEELVYEELSIDELITKQIDDLQDVSDEDKSVLHSLSTRYLTQARNELDLH